MIDAAVPDVVPSSPFPAFMVWEAFEDPRVPSIAASDYIPSLSLVEQRPGPLSPVNFSPGQFNFSPAIWSDSMSANEGQKTPEQILLDLGFFRFEKRLLDGAGMQTFESYILVYTNLP